MSRLDLFGACAKLDRALLHLSEIGDHFQALNIVGSRYVTEAVEEQHPDPQGVRHLFRIGPLVRPTPEFGTVVGDYIQNLRAALDYLAWEMVRNGSDPPGRDGGLSVLFPIYRRMWAKRGRNNFRAQVPRRLPGVPREQLVYVRSFQPYHKRRPKWQLGALADLSNRDKHRVLTPVHSFASRFTRRHLSASTGPIHRWRRLVEFGQPVDERTPFVEAVVDPGAEVLLMTGVASKIVFESRPGRDHVDTDLLDIGSVVASVVGGAAKRWGDEAHAAYCAAWTATATYALRTGIPNPARVEAIVRAVMQGVEGDLYPESMLFLGTLLGTEQHPNE
jgi:hypothetical protein